MQKHSTLFDKGLWLRIEFALKLGNNGATTGAFYFPQAISSNIEDPYWKMIKIIFLKNIPNDIKSQLIKTKATKIF